jgi:hypothetical protein
VPLRFVTKYVWHLPGQDIARVRAADLLPYVEAARRAGTRRRARLASMQVKLVVEANQD